MRYANMYEDIHNGKENYIHEKVLLFNVVWYPVCF